MNKDECGDDGHHGYLWSGWLRGVWMTFFCHWGELIYDRSIVYECAWDTNIGTHNW